MDPAGDPVIRQLREQVSDNDRALVDALNKRLNSSRSSRATRSEHGLDFVDPQREEWMLRDLTRFNGGPLSAEGLEQIYAAILDLTKREVS